MWSKAACPASNATARFSTSLTHKSRNLARASGPLRDGQRRLQNSSAAVVKSGSALKYRTSLPSRPTSYVHPEKNFAGFQRKFTGIRAIPEETIESSGDEVSQNGAELASTDEPERKNRAKAIELVFWIAAAIAFGTVITATQGVSKGSEYFAGYLLEESLSVDNLFVFVLIFSYFDVPQNLQARVLLYGIWGAAIMRAGMVLVGAAAIERFEPILLVFAGILIYSSYSLLTAGGEEEEDFGENSILKFCRKFIPVSEEMDGENFFTQVQEGGAMVTKATPLLLVLAVVELSDVVFAVDSIPAVFGVTQDPFIVYTSNMFAIFGLRSLYYFVSSAVEDLKYLQPAVALVLGFVGTKMVAEFGGADIPTETSLAVVATLLAGGIGLSLLDPKDPDAESET